MTNVSILSPAPADTPRGNALDEVGDKKRVLRVWQSARVGPSKRRLEFMQFGADGLRPLIFLHSLEYANCPAWGFCVDAAEAGFGTFAIRRPGFGASDRVGAVDEQAALLGQFLDEAKLENVVLVSVGSACPVGYRLAAASPRVSYSAYVNCVFNRDILLEFRPQWFGPILVQALKNPAGARVSLEALRQIARRVGPSRFYETVTQKSPGDVEFVRNFVRDVEAAWAVGSTIHWDTFRDEMRYSLSDDAFLTDGVFAKMRGIALSGAETTSTWKAGFEAESKRVGIPFGYLPRGDIFAAYQSGGALLELLRECA
jgi:pimeloyl-ACP methyl ester carboxylesterase